MKKHNRKRQFISMLCIISMLICMLPSNAFAILGAEQRLHLRDVQGVDDSQASETCFYLENDYIRFDMEVGKKDSDPIRFTTQPTRTKIPMADAIKKGTYQEVYFTIVGNRVKDVERNIKKGIEYLDGDEAYPYIQADYYFKGKSEYHASVRYSLVKLDEGMQSGKSEGGQIYFNEDDPQRTYGVRAVASIGYKNTPSTYLDKTNVNMWLCMHKFDATGHPDTKQTATMHMNTAIGDTSNGFTLDSTPIPYALSSTKTNVATGKAWNSEAITEINTQGYSWANPFAATSSLYPEYVYGTYYDDFFDGAGFSAGNLPCEFSTSSSGDLTLKFDYAPLQGREFPRYSSSALWGFRDLYKKSETSFTPSDNVKVAANAKYMGIYKDGDAFKAIPANSEKELTANNSKYGSPIASIRGNFTEKNDRYYFTKGVAALSSTVTAVWSTSSGELSVGKDGSIKAKHVALNCPSFKFYAEKASASEDALKLSASADGITAEIDPSVNSAVISVDIPNATSQLTGAIIKPNGNLCFDGSIGFEWFEGAELNLESLQYGLNKGKFKLNGIKAEGSFSTANMLGLEMADVQAEIDTTDNKKIYNFDLELNVFDLFEAQAILHLARYGESGALLPDQIYFFVGSEVAKIPLVPPVVLAHITGAGGGVNNLATTAKGDFFAIPPITFDLTGRGKALGVLEGTANYTFGPAYYKFTASDVEFMKKIKLLKEFSFYEGIRSDSRVYSGTKYNGLSALGGVKIVIAAPGDEDWSFVEAGGNLDASAFAGLDSIKNPSQIYVVADINGKVYGKLSVPKKIPIIGGLKLAEKNLDAYLGAKTQMKVSGGFDNAIKTAFDNFSVYGGVKFQSDWGLFKYRVWYIFPESELHSETKPIGKSLSAWNWSDHLPTGYSLLETEGGRAAVIGLNVDDIEYSTSGYSLRSSAAPYTYTASLDEDADSDATVMLMAIPKKQNADMEAFAQSITVKKGDTPITLTYPEFNEDEEITNDSDVNAMITENAEGKNCIIIGVGTNGKKADQWSITSTSEDFDISINTSLPFDSVAATMVDDDDTATIKSSIKNADEDANYVVCTYLGTTRGSGEYLIAQETVEDLEDITTVIPKNGTALPTGEYFVTVKIMREERAQAASIAPFSAQGRAVSSVLLPIDSTEISTPISYTNTLQPQAPSSAEIKPVGNEIMQASWAESKSNPDGYRIKIYTKDGDDYEDSGRGYSYDAQDIKDGKIQGISYDAATKTYSLDMALTAGGNNITTDENGNVLSSTASPFTANMDYKISVSAYNYMREDGDIIKNSQTYSSETYSNNKVLPEYTPVKVTGIKVRDMAPNITTEAVRNSETGIWNASASASPYYNSKADIGETWEVSVDTEAQNSIQCKVSRVGNGNYALDEYYMGSSYYYRMNHHNIEGSIMLRIDIETDKGDYKDVTTQYLLIDKDNVAPFISTNSNICYADPNTGKYTVDGISEPGAKVVVDGVNSGEVTVGEDGTFSFTDDAFKKRIHKYDYGKGFLYDEQGNPIYEWNDIDADDRGGLISLYAKDSCGNQSERIVLALSIGENPEEDTSGDEGDNDNTSSSGGGGGLSYSDRTVTFETNGGSKVTSQNVVNNSILKEPTQPTKDGFTFDGWYSDKELTQKYDFSKKVTEDITLYAKWTESSSETETKTTPFTDVDEDDWYFENVNYAFENGLMSGTTDTEFAPNIPLTRAMLVAVLYRAEGSPAVNKSIPFADVSANAYYCDAVIWAQQNGIVSGMSETEFAPDENITREQIAAIMFRYAKYKGYDVSVGESTNILSYTDFDEISEYAIEAMQYAVGSGLIKGKTETTLNPKGSATRAEIAAILNRFIENNK